MIGFVAVVAAAFVVMEPATYLAHRFVMHGLGRTLHRSHHRRWDPRSRSSRRPGTTATGSGRPSGTLIGAEDVQNGIRGRSSRRPGTTATGSGRPSGTLIGAEDVQNGIRRGRVGRRDGEGFFEANDAFPVVFASVTVAALAVGFNVDGWGVLLPVCVGVTLYGATYAFVHDAYIHGRVPVRRRSSRLDRLADAHALHHRFGGEPYGMLWPVVPAAVRERAVRADEAAEPVDRSVQRVDAVPGA